MAIIVTATLLALSCSLLYFHFRTALIPYGRFVNPSRAKLIVTSVSVTAAWFVGCSASSEGLRAFGGMLALAMVLTPALAPNISDAFRTEDDGQGSRFIAWIKSKASGALMIKLICLPLAFLASTYIGQYWLAVLGVVAIFNLLGMGHRRRDVILSFEAFRELPIERRVAIHNGMIRWDLGCVVGLALWLSIFGFMTIDNAPILATNWNAWAGLGAGALLSLIVLVLVPE